MNFFNEPHDVQVILGLTLVGIPDTWDEITLVGFVKSYSYAFGPNEVCIISTFLEDSNNGIRRAHITCSNLYSKQKLLKIRLIPVIIGYEEKNCQIITVRPYCFWIQLSCDSVPIPYMLPKYGSQDISYESIEAKMLLHESNIHPSIVTCLMEYNLIPKDGSFWCASDAIATWLAAKDQDQKLFDCLETLFGKVQDAASTFEPYPYNINDESVYSSNWNQVLLQPNSQGQTQVLWPWEADANSGAMTPEPRPKQGRKHGTKKIGCIRYESNRKRWVVDMSIEGRRLQKCFHETFFGLQGGLAEALRWRFEFLLTSKTPISSQSELKCIADIFDKIMQLNMLEGDKYRLIDTLRNPHERFSDVCPIAELNEFIDKKLQKIHTSSGRETESVTSEYVEQNGIEDREDFMNRRRLRNKRKFWKERTR
ncbi:hypothetical protein MACJ_002133 [Theileria orientalis]|uniref:Uncharacterized protein n=1 Tax=Theileria orientalis TaxID=68886 RepID=A0A976M5P8_THEOR|nr:hypothetical protein MACJ_002133 [Theileria orientalis]